MSATSAENYRIQGLAELIAAQAGDKLPPVDKWDPPYRGDIGLTITGDGTWLYQGSPIHRKSLVRLFARVLRRDGDGRHYLVTPAERVDVDVAEAPFLAVEMEVEGAGEDQTLVFRTNVDDIVRCGPDHPLRFAEEKPDGGLKPYLMVRAGLEALVTRALFYDLVALAITRECEGREQLGVWSGGTFFVLS